MVRRHGSGGNRRKKRMSRVIRRKVVKRAPKPRRIVIGGMHRSCSTWATNAVRLLTIAAGKSFKQSRGPATFKGLKPAQVHIIKAHRYTPAFKPAFLIVTMRHLFDAVTSELRMGLQGGMDAYRRFGIDDERTVQRMDYIVSRSYEWVRVADVVMRYEDIVEDKVWHIEWLAETLYPGVTIDAEAIDTELEAIPGRVTVDRTQPYMMSPGHVTGVGVGGWRKHMPDDLLAFMIDRYSNWFKVHGYEGGYE